MSAAVLLLFGTVAASGCSDVPAAKGRESRFAAVAVAISADGEPVAQGMVMLLPASRRGEAAPARHTGTDGRAVLDSLRPDRYVVQVYPNILSHGPCNAQAARFGPWDGRMMQSDTVQLGAGQRAAFEIAFTCAFAPLRAELDVFRRIAREGERIETYVDTPVVAGRLLVVDERGIDRLTFELPPELRPRSPDEVATIAVISCGKEIVGMYSGGAPATSTQCSVTLVDRARRQALSRRTFSSSPPGQVRTGPGGAPLGPTSGRYPLAEIREYLAGARRSGVDPQHPNADDSE